jgi:hypothetical protein
LTFDISDFEIDGRISVSVGQFQNFELSNLPIVKVKNVNIAGSYSHLPLVHFTPRLMVILFFFRRKRS